MERIVEKDIRKKTGPGKLYEVGLYNRKLNYIETNKSFFELSTWDHYCTCCSRGCFIDVSSVEGSRIVGSLKKIFGADAKIIAFADAWSNSDCYKDDYIFKTSAPDRYGFFSVQPETGVSYLVCVPHGRKLDFSSIEGEMVKDESVLYFPQSQ